MAEAAGILPIPREIRSTDGRFCVDEHTLILLLPSCNEEVYGSAAQLADEIRERTGQRPKVVQGARVPRGENIIVLCGDVEAGRAYLGESLAGEGLAAHGPEAYAISISPERVIAAGEGAVALRHAIQTLRQIARLEGSYWPACEILDWPALAYRGVMLDVSRGKVPTLQTLKEVVDCLAFFKMNVLQLYTEHTFDFVSHPAIGRGTDPLTSEDMLVLDRYAREQGVQLMPNLNCFGHCSHLLSLPQYAHLAESAVPWTLTPVDEGTYALLGNLLDDMLPSFSCRTLNAGCDETWDLGLGRSASLAAEIGVGRVYLGHLLRLHDLASARVCRVQFWGDILLHHPELVGELPDDVTLLDWHYEAQESYSSLDVFAQSGRRFWVCPGTSSWNTLFPRIGNANGNIRNLVRQGTERGAEGMLNTDWGDHGHYQPLGLSWYGYAFGAAQAWSGGTTTDDEFDGRFGPLWFGPEGAQVIESVRALGALNTLSGMPRPNNSNSIHMLLDEPLAGPVPDALPDETLDAILAVTAGAMAAFRSAWAFSRDRHTLEEMSHSCAWMAFAARKAKLTRQIRASLASGGKCIGDVAQHAAAALQELADDLVPLRQAFEALWLGRARPSEIAQHLGALEALSERFGLARDWLMAIAREEHAALDTDAYLAATPRYEYLGQRFWRQMREINPTL